MDIKISDKVSLPFNGKLAAEDKQFIPKETSFSDHANLLEQIAISLNNNLPVLLIGETGTGKTSVIRHLAALTGNAYRRVNHNGGTTVDDIVGKVLINKDGTYWVDGVLIEAMRRGWWYLADEINAASAEINFVYHSLLDDDGFIVLSEKDGEVVRPHKNFKFFAGMNPSETYSGTKEINKALMSRFVVIKADFAPPKVETQILTDREGITADTAKKMIAFAGEIRANHVKEKYNFVLSTRDLLMWARLFKVYQRFIPSAELAILNKVNNEDLDSIKDLLSLHFATLDKAKTQ